MHVTTPRLVSSGSVRLVAISLGFFVGRLMQTIEDIILRHSARGMTRLVSELPCDFCAEAAREIASWPRDTVASAHGFRCGRFARDRWPCRHVCGGESAHRSWVFTNCGFGASYVRVFFGAWGENVRGVAGMRCGVHGNAARYVGATGRRELSVDGFGLDVERKIVEALLCA